MTPRLSILLALLAMALPLKGQDQLQFVWFGTNATVITGVALAEAPEKKVEESLERRINRFLCRVSEFFTPRVKLPNGYYLKVSNGVVWLHDKKGDVILDESAQDFLVKEPYVAVWGGKVVYFLKSDSGEITSAPLEYYTPLPRGDGSVCIKDFITFWDIKTGYKPVTWLQK